MRLQEKVAVVTGAGKGIGACIAKRFAKAGAKVVINDIDAEAGQNVSAGINAQGGTASFVHGDVSKEPDIEKMVAACIRTYGSPNILVNNAGIEFVRFIHDMTEDEWTRIMDINMKGVFLGSKHVARQMLAGGNGGSIINVSSVAGIRALPGLGAYCATKHGVIGLTKTMALELRSNNIRVNAICPGFIKTDLLDNTSNAYKDLGVDIEEVVSSRQHRLGNVEEIASTAVYLASDESSFVSGVALPVDFAMSALA